MKLINKCINFYMVFLMISGSMAFINRAPFKYHYNPKSFINRNSSLLGNSSKYINKRLYREPCGSTRAQIYNPTKQDIKPNKYPLMLINHNNNFMILINCLWFFTFLHLDNRGPPPPPPRGILIPIPIENTQQLAWLEVGMWTVFIGTMRLVGII